MRLGLLLLLSAAGCAQVAGLDDLAFRGSAAAVGGAGVGGRGGEGVGGGVAWLDSAHAFRKSVALRTSLATERVEHVPLAVVLQHDAELVAATRPDGYDISFTAADGVTRLHHEIERYDGATGELVAWVRVPAIEAGQDTSLHLYYGAPDSGDQQDVANTYNDDFAAVWHMAEPLKDALSRSRDSTRNAAHGVAPWTSASPASVEAAAGQGYSFDGVDDTLAVASEAVLNFGSASFSVSLWINAASGDATLLKKQTAGGGTGFVLRALGDNWLFIMLDGTGADSSPLGTTAKLAGGMHHLTIAVDHSQNRIVTYRDGSAIGDQAMLATGDSSTTTELFFSPDYASYSGILDEVRLHTSALSSSWVALHHANLTDASFVSLGPVQARP